MHISNFFEKDQPRNPSPKNWWKRESVWYGRVLMVATTIFGLSMMLYLPIGYVTMPVDIRTQAGTTGFVLIAIFTVAGLILLKAGVMGAIHSFKNTDGVSHGEAFLACLIAILLATPFSFYLENEIDEASKLTAETKMLEVKIKSMQEAR